MVHGPLLAVAIIGVQIHVRVVGEETVFRLTELNIIHLQETCIETKQLNIVKISTLLKLLQSDVHMQHYPAFGER